MNKKEINLLIRSYLKRNSVLENNNNIGIARSKESLVKKYIANRNRQLGTFIVDAILLKDLFIEEESKCDNPRFPSGVIQYYLLTEDQLINYFAYRTLIKRGQLPINNHTSFLIIYLMEIVNGLYGYCYQDKKKKLDSVAFLYPKGAKYRSLIQEAYEVLYFQNIDSLNIDEYIHDVNFPIFNKIEFLDYDNDDIAFHCNAESIIDFIDLEKYTAINAKDKFILNDCFEYLYKELYDRDDFDINLKTMLSFDYKVSNDSPINKLKTTYPLNTKIKYKNKKGNIEEIVNGYHITKKPYFDDYKFYKIKNYVILIINSIQHNCGNIPLPRISKVKRSFESYFESNIREEKQKPQMIIDECLRKWVAENPYSKKGYLQSLDTLKKLKELGDFKLDISDVNNVRKKSSDIQDKLIIEDDTMNIYSPKKVSNPFVVNSLHSDNPVNYFSKLSKEKAKDDDIKIDNKSFSSEFIELNTVLSDLEKSVLLQLCNNDIAKAEDIAFENNEMLSLVIDNINTKSNSVLEDVVIIDNEIVEDYKDNLQKMLNK